MTISRNMRIVLILIGGVLALCCLLGAALTFFLPQFASRFAEEAIVNDPAQAAAVANDIVDYELPPGFVAEGAMAVLGIDMVFMVPEDGQDAFIIVTQFPQSMAGNEEAMQRQMEETFSRQFDRQNVTLMFEGIEPITINGQETTLSIYEGKGENGVDVRQATAVFTSKSEQPAMIMVFAPIANWEERGIEAFLQSLE